MSLFVGVNVIFDIPCWYLLQ